MADPTLGLYWFVKKRF